MRRRGRPAGRLAWGRPPGSQAESRTSSLYAIDVRQASVFFTHFRLILKIARIPAELTVPDPFPNRIFRRNRTETGWPAPTRPLSAETRPGPRGSMSGCPGTSPIVVAGVPAERPYQRSRPSPETMMGRTPRAPPHHRGSEWHYGRSRTIRLRLARAAVLRETTRGPMLGPSIQTQ